MFWRMLQRAGTPVGLPPHTRAFAKTEDEMSSMTVWKFPTPYGADAALAKLQGLQLVQGRVGTVGRGELPDGH